MGKERSQINLQYDRQLENQQDQNNWQSSENSVDRQWQAEQWQHQFESQLQAQRDLFSEQLDKQRESDLQKWKDQFDIENQYNSPQNQVARLMAAGVNPSAAVSALTSGVSSASIGGSSAPSGASAPSGGSVGSHSVSPLGISMPAYSTDAALFSSASQLVDSLGKLAKSGVDVYDTASKVKPTVDNMIADTKQKQEETALTALNRGLVTAYGDKKAAAEVLKLSADSYAAYTSGDLHEAQRLLASAEQKFTESKTLANEEQRPIVLSNLKKLGDLYTSEKDLNYERGRTEQTQQRVNTAQLFEIDSRVQMNDALTETYNKLRDGQVTAQVLDNGLKAIEYGLKTNSLERDNKTQDAQVRAILDECAQKGYVSDYMRTKALDAWNDHRWNEFNHWFGIIQGTVHSGVELGTFGQSIPKGSVSSPAPKNPYYDY